MKLFVNLFLVVVSCVFAVSPESVKSLTVKNKTDIPGEQSITKAELQWMICEQDESTLLQKLSLQKEAVQERQLYFFDTESLDLFKRGIVIRTKALGDKMITIFKTQYATEDLIEWSFLSNKNVFCEKNIFSSAVNFECKLRNVLASWTDPLSDEQLDYLRLKYPDYVGPLKFYGIAQESHVELMVEDQKLFLSWIQLDNGKIVQELFAKTNVGEEDETQQAVLNFLAEKDLSLCSSQSDRTQEIIESYRW